MKAQTFFRSLAVATFVISANSANAATTYILKMTNGGPMPLSPAVVYAKNGQAPNALVGQMPTTGFIRLCETGNPSMRAMELDASSDVTFVGQTNAPIMPGESKEIEIQVADPLTQSIQVETMYGKTKDICATASIGSHSLLALKKHVTSEVLLKDNVVASGAYLDPSIPAGTSGQVCSAAPDAVSCLRMLAGKNPGPQKIRFFSSYLPSVVMLLEENYGAADTQTLLLPSSGAVQLQLKLKH